MTGRLTFQTLITSINRFHQNYVLKLQFQLKVQGQLSHEGTPNGSIVIFKNFIGYLVYLTSRNPSSRLYSQQVSQHRPVNQKNVQIYLYRRPRYLFNFQNLDHLTLAQMISFLQGTQMDAISIPSSASYAFSLRQLVQQTIYQQLSFIYRPKLSILKQLFSDHSY